MRSHLPAQRPGLPVTFQLARLDDAPWIARLSRDSVEYGLPWRWTPERVARFIRHRDCNGVTAWQGRRPAGFALMEYHTEYAHLNLLAVDPRNRRLGVGRRLVEWLETTARVAGLRFIRLEVRADNRGARAFYRALGYGERWTIPGYYSGRETAVCLTRDLRDRCPSDAP